MADDKKDDAKTEEEVETKPEPEKKPEIKEQSVVEKRTIALNQALKQTVLAIDDLTTATQKARILFAAAIMTGCENEITELLSASEE